MRKGITLTPSPSPRTGEGSKDGRTQSAPTYEYPVIDLATRNMLSMIEIVVIEMGEAAKKVIEYPHLAKPFMHDMVEFNNKLKTYKTMEVKDEHQ